MTGVTPQQYMENWLNEPNYPEVSAILENNGQRVRFDQARFLLAQDSFRSKEYIFSLLFIFSFFLLKNFLSKLHLDDLLKMQSWWF